MPYRDENAEHMAASHELWNQLRGGKVTGGGFTPFDNYNYRQEPMRRTMPWDNWGKRDPLDQPLRQPEPPKAEPKLEPVKETKPMRGLYKVYIVDPEFDMVIYKGEHVATDDGGAKMEAAIKATLAKTYQDYDFIVTRLGNVRDKQEIQAAQLQALMLSRFAGDDRRPLQVVQATEKAIKKAKGDD